MTLLTLETTGEGNAGPRSRNTVWAFLLLLVVVGLAYSNSLNAIWTIDDGPNILQNLQVHIGDLRPQTLFKTFFSPLHPDANGVPGLNRPLAHMSFALNWYFGQDSPVGYRLVNIFIHLLNASLLFIVLRSLLQTPDLRGRNKGREGSIALLATVLWALNPIQTQVVVYIVQRMASLACFFYLLAIWSYLRVRICPNSRRRIGYALLTAASFLAAIGSKENAVMLPGALVLLEFTFYQDWSQPTVRRRFGWILGVGCGLLLVGCGLLFAAGNPAELLGYGIRLFSPWERLLTQPRVLLFYLSQLFYPIPGQLSLVHDVEISRSLVAPWTTLPAILGVLGLVGIGFWQMRRRPMLSFAILFFFLNHMVESSIIGLELIYEHRNYLPSLFLFVPMAAGLQALATHKRLKSPGFQRLVVLLIILLPVSFGIGTYVRNMAWLDAKIFWEDAGRKAPLSMRPLHNLAYYHYEKTGQHHKAFDLYHEALGKQDNNRLVMSLPHIKIAEHYERREEFEKAGEHLEKALAIFPEFEQVQLRLALARFSAGQLEKALAAIVPLVEKRPGSFDSRYLMAQILLKMGQTENALSHLQTCMLLAPNSEKAVFMMGIASNLFRNCEKAQRFLNRVLERFPKDKQALLWMIDSHLQTGDFAAAKNYTWKFLEGVSIDRIEHTVAQTLSEGFMAEDDQKRLSLWIKNQAHAGSDPKLETWKETEATSARKQRYGA